MKKILLVLLLLVPIKAHAEGCIGPYGCVAKTRGVSVTSTATQLDTQPNGRDSVCVWNNGAATLYIGFTGVTTANGIPLSAGAGPMCFNYGSNIAIFGIVASGTLDVRVLEQGGLGRPAGAPGVVR